MFQNHQFQQDPRHYPDFKLLTPEKFLERLDAVCDSFQPLDTATSYLIEVKGDEAPQSPRAFQLANAEGALSRLVEEAMWSGPIRHMAICVMAQRVIMLSDSMRSDPNNAPGGRELMVSLLSSVKQMCAANTGDITISRHDKFSGRIVILFGSASCTGEQLLKDCGERYRDIDQNCMLIAVSMGAEPAGSAQLGKTIAAAVNAWGEAEAKNGPPGTAGGAGRPELLIHLFGGAGFTAWAKVLKLWMEQYHYPDEKRLTGRMLPLDKILKGVVLDSAPGALGRWGTKAATERSRCQRPSLSFVSLSLDIAERRRGRRFWHNSAWSFSDGARRCCFAVCADLRGRLQASSGSVQRGFNQEKYPSKKI